MMGTSAGLSLWIPALALLCAAAALGCNGDDDDDGAASDGGGAPATTRDGGQMRSGACELGCEDTVNAGCAMGPATQLQCETDCERLRTGDCGSEYRAYMACGDGKRVTCDAMGFPVIAACPDARDAFLSCLN